MSCEYDLDDNYVYFRKSYPIDYVIRDYATWYIDSEYYYISPENAKKLQEHCFRILRMFKPIHNLSDDEILKLDIDKTLDEIIFEYPEGSK